MGSIIKHPKDFFAGLMYTAIGSGAIGLEQQLLVNTQKKVSA